MTEAPLATTDDDGGGGGGGGTMHDLSLLTFELHEEIGEACEATQSASIMVYADMATPELQLLLGAVFGLTQPTSIAAVQLQPSGHIVPLSYICRNPSAFAGEAIGALHLLIARPFVERSGDAGGKRASLPSIAPIVDKAAGAGTAGRVEPGAAREDDRDALLDVLRALVDPQLPMVTAAESIALQARIESNDRQLFQCYEAFRRSGGDMMTLVQEMMAMAKVDADCEPPALELILARIWFLKQRKLVSPDECLALQNLARDGDALVETVFSVYSRRNVDDQVLAERLLQALTGQSLDDPIAVQDRARLAQFRSQIVRDLSQADLLDGREVDQVETAISEGWESIEAPFATFAENGDAGRLAVALAEHDDDAQARSDTDWLLHALREQHGFSEHWTDQIEQMIARADPVVLGALDLFDENHDFAELIETLDEILVKSAANPPPAPMPAAGTTAPTGRAVPPLEPVQRRHLCKLTDDLFKESLVDQEHLSLLKGLVLSRDPVVEAAYSLFSCDKDWAEFADTSVRVACREHGGATHVVQAADLPAERLLKSLATDGTLADADAIALLQASNTHDPVLLGICDAFEYDRDRRELQDSLRRLAGRLHEQQQQQQQQQQQATAV